MSKESTSGGSSFLTLLAIAFIVLKLTDVIDWSWWWVLSPIWLPVVIIIPLAIIWALYENRKSKKELEEIKKERDEFLKRPKGKFQQRMEEMQNRRAE